jgi:RNA polymerase sigma-70 factor (ECF subfamily)
VAENGETTLIRLESCLKRMKAADPSARDDLIRMSYHRLDGLVRRMLKKDDRVTSWEQVDDLVQNAALRLWRSLEKVTPGSVEEFLGLAATQIRRELVDLARHYFGPHGPGTHQVAPGPGGAGQDGTTVPAFDAAESTYDPSRLAAWAEFHRAVEGLPDVERKLCEMLWYLGLRQDEVAELLGVDVSTVKRRWRAVRLKLHRAVVGWDDAD